MTAEDRPKRLSLSQVLEMVLTRAGDRSSVTLARNAGGETLIEVKVRTGDEDNGIVTVDDAERKAQEVYARLAELYPPAVGHDSSQMSLTRNAKGETQVDVTIKSGELGYRSIDEIADKIVTAYDKARMKYPMADGRTAKPGSVA